MSLDLTYIIPFAVLAVLFQGAFAVLIRPRLTSKKFLRNWWWPEIKDSAVIVFHYTCLAGVFLATIYMLIGAFKAIPDAPIGQSPHESIATMIPFLQDFGAMLFMWLSGLWVANALVVLLLQIYGAFYQDQEELRRRTNSQHDGTNAKLTKLEETVSSTGGEVIRTRTGVHNIYLELRSLYELLRPPKVAAETLLCAASELYGLKPPDNSLADFGKDIHLVLSVDSILPNSFEPAIPTVLFSQIQVNWSENYRDFDQNHVIRIAKKQIGRNPRYFQSSTGDMAGAMLDTLLGEALATCANQLAKNHAPGAFNANCGSLNEMPYPRALRVLLGDGASLVNTANDFSVLDCAFPSFTRSRVSNLWLPKTTGQTLFQVAQSVENGKSHPEFPGFVSKWKKPVMDFLQSKDVYASEDEVFSHVSRFTSDEWPELDCLQIGLRLRQVGYKQRPLFARPTADQDETKRQMLIFCVGLFPVILAALHYRSVLSFPDAMHYVRSKCDDLDEDKRKMTRMALMKQLDEFQKTGIFRQLLELYENDEK